MQSGFSYDPSKLARLGVSELQCFGEKLCPGVAVLGPQV